MTIFRAAALCAALAIAAAACSASQSPPANTALTREQTAVDRLHLKQRYKNVVMGTDIKDSTLVLYVDEDRLESMDESAEDGMLAGTLADWKAIWMRQHRGHHALVRLRLSNYYGQEVLTRSVRA